MGGVAVRKVSGGRHLVVQKALVDGNIWVALLVSVWVRRPASKGVDPGKFPASDATGVFAHLHTLSVHFRPPSYG
jgi:hypothetical protein